MSDSLWPHGLYSPWNSPGQDTRESSLSLLQVIFPTQESNPGLPHCRLILYHVSHKGSPRILEWVAYPFSSRSSQPRNWTGVSCIAGRFLTSWATKIKQVTISSHLCPCPGPSPCVCTYVCMCEHLCASVCAFLCVSVCPFVCVCVHLCVCLWASVCVSLCVWAFLCVCLWEPVGMGLGSGIEVNVKDTQSLA